MKKIITIVSLILSFSSFASGLDSYEGFYEDQIGKDSFARSCGQKIEVSGNYINITDIPYQNLPGKESAVSGECTSDGTLNSYKCTYKNCVNISEGDSNCRELFLLPKGIIVNINKCTSKSRKLVKIEISH